MALVTEGRQKTRVGDGVLIVNKEAGWTSHDVVAKVRGLLGGHSRSKQTIGPAPHPI